MTNFAPSAVAAIAIVASQVLKFLGIEIGDEALTTTITTIIAVVGGLIVYMRQLSTKRSTALGGRPKGFRG